MVSEQGEAIGGYPQHLTSHLPCPPQAVLGGPVSGFDPRVLRAAAPGRGGHGLAGLTGRQWGLGRFPQSEPLLAALLALPLVSAQPLRPSPSGRLARGHPEGWAPPLARGSIRAACPSPCAFLPGACAGGPGRVGRAVLPLLWPRSRHARAPAPPAQPCSPCGRKALLLLPPCPGARGGAGPQPAALRSEAAPSAQSHLVNKQLLAGAQGSPHHSLACSQAESSPQWGLEAGAVLRPSPPPPVCAAPPGAERRRGLGHVACQPLPGLQAWVPADPAPALGSSGQHPCQLRAPLLGPPLSPRAMSPLWVTVRVGVQNALYAPDGHPAVSWMVTRWSLGPSDGPMGRGSLLGRGRGED